MTWEDALQVARERAGFTGKKHYVRGYMRGKGLGWGYQVFIIPRRK